jgi:hypothetical protein
VADPKPQPDPVQTQRMLVYTIIGLLCLAGLIMAVAFSDPCKAYGGEAKLGLIGKKCSDVVAWTDWLPSIHAWISVAIILAANVLIYELRFYLRVHGVAAVGAIFFVNAGIIAVDGLPVPLIVFYALFGVAMVLAAWGIQRERREGWSAALAICAVLLTGHFFGAAKIAQETGWSMAYALLPSMGLLLPLVVALLCSPPGAPRVKPFARTAVASSPQSAF